MTIKHAAAAITTRIPTTSESLFNTLRKCFPKYWSSNDCKPNCSGTQVNYQLTPCLSVCVCWSVWALLLMYVRERDFTSKSLPWAHSCLPACLCVSATLCPSPQAVLIRKTEQPNKPVSWGRNTVLTELLAGGRWRGGSWLSCCHIHTQAGLRVWSGLISSVHQATEQPWPNFN